MPEPSVFAGFAFDFVSGGAGMGPAPVTEVRCFPARRNRRGRLEDVFFVFILRLRRIAQFEPFFGAFFHGFPGCALYFTEQVLSAGAIDEARHAATLPSFSGGCRDGQLVGILVVGGLGFVAVGVERLFDLVQHVCAIEGFVWSQREFFAFFFFFRFCPVWVSYDRRLLRAGAVFTRRFADFVVDEVR